MMPAPKKSTGLKLIAFLCFALLFIVSCDLDFQETPQDIRVIDVGYTQCPDDEMTSVGIILENPNEQLTAESVELTVTLRDSSGSAIGKTQDILPLFPEESRLGVAADVYIEEVNGEVFDIDVGVEADQFSERKVPETKVGRVRIKQTSHTTIVEGKLTNLAEKHLSDVRVDAIILDDGGNIKGGGFSFLSTLPKEERLGFAIDTFIRVTDADEARVYIWPTE